MTDKEILMYAHAGSGNHGCEAIVRSVCGILGKENSMAVISHDIEEDQKYGLDSVCRLIQERDIDKNFFVHASYYAMRKITGNGENFLKYRYADAEPFDKYKLAVSIGGDNYCYDMMIPDLERANSMFNHQGLCTVLLGCSIEPELIKNRADIRADMKLYKRIIARESITYNALKEAEIDNAVLCPDPAFALKPGKTEIPAGFVTYKSCDGRSCSGMVGINVSPMVQDFAMTDAGRCGSDDADIVMRNYERLIEYILKNTDMNVALIPHVIWGRSDDQKPLQQIYDKYIDTGRVISVSDRNCTELKTIISKCRFFVGARTHATIAAYSSCVPTLVLGYSVKSRGIARDLFGTDEHYVIPVQKLASEEELIDGFRWLTDNESKIRENMQKMIKDYMAKTDKLSEYIDVR